MTLPSVDSSPDTTFVVVCLCCLYILRHLITTKAVILAFGYGYSDRRKAVCCPAGAKIYCSQIGCRTPKAFYPVGSIASSAEVRGSEHDVLSFSVEAKNAQRMYECLLPHTYVYQWCLESCIFPWHELHLV
jgi:hypothetical protein